MAQKIPQPRGLYQLTEIVHQDGTRREAGFAQYKYCQEGVWLTLSHSFNGFFGAPFNFALSNPDGHALRTTGELSKTENKGSQVFGQDVRQAFTLRWYNDRGSFNERLFPVNSNIDERYRSVTDSTNVMLRAVNLFKMQLGEQKHRLKGAWKLRGRQHENNALSPFWVEESAREVYQIFGASDLLTVFANGDFPAGTLQCNMEACEYLGETAYRADERTAMVHWLDGNTISVTSLDAQGRPVVNIWDRCGLPQNIQAVFGTQVPTMSKDVSRFLRSRFLQKYGERPDSICRAYETYHYAVDLNEQNNAIFPKLMQAGLRDTYEALRDTLELQLLRGAIGADEAVGRYVFWFFKNFDRHTNCTSRTFARLCQELDVDYGKWMKQYAPAPVGCKVDAETYLLRLPSCLGHLPTWEWMLEKQKEFEASGCPYLILDLRGNEGGSDEFSTLFAEYLCDAPIQAEKRVVYRSSLRNNRYFKRLMGGSPRGQSFLERAEESNEGDFLEWAVFPKGSPIEIHPQVRKGAILVDRNTASAGETAVMLLRLCSQSRAKVYGRERTYGSEKTGNVNVVALPNSTMSLTYPLTVDDDFEQSCKASEPGWKPDVLVPLPYPERLTDNIDSWVLWVAKQLKQ